jgi:uncharacterized membrane protein YsdA (DUF1294 family)
MIVGTGYVLFINLITFCLFVHDKQQAIHHGWRISEKGLYATAVLGGWLGGWMAMTIFRHKTQKMIFMIIYGACNAVNVAVCFSVVWVVCRPFV